MSKSKYWLNRGALAAFVTLSLGHVAQAATFEVDTTADGVDALVGDGVCASFSGTCTLRAAVQETNALAGADTILLPAGRYRPALGLNDEDNGAEGDFDIRDDLIIRGAGTESTTVDGEFGTFRVFDILLRPDNSQPTITFEEFSIKDGLSNTRAGSLVRNDGVLTLQNMVVSGGGEAASAIHSEPDTTLSVENSVFRNNCTALRIENGSLTVKNSEFTDNNCNSGDANTGGAIYATASLVVLENSNFTGNHGDNGGAVYSTGQTYISDSRFEKNTAGLGGAVYLARGGYQIENSDFIDNNASRSGGAFYIAGGGLGLINSINVTGNVADSSGGGIYLVSDGLTHISDITLSGNRAIDNAGGGAFLHGNAVHLSDAVIENNVAADEGGGLYLEGGIVVNNSLIVENQSRLGAGVFSDNDIAPSELRNTTVSANVATFRGGGVYVFESFSSDANDRLDLIHTTVVSNSAAEGGGANVYQERGFVRLRASIVANAANGENCVGTVLSLGFNVSTDDSCGLVAEGDIQTADVQLQALASNGSSIQTHGLTAGSAAIGAVPTDFCADVDQRYHSRKVSSACAIGAYEPGALRAVSGVANFSSASYQVFESGVSLSLKLERMGGNQGQVSVLVRDTRLGTAILGTDYEFDVSRNVSYETVSWADGEVGEKTVLLGINDDRNENGNVEALFSLEAHSGGLQPGPINETTVRILDDETPQNDSGDDDTDSGSDTDAGGDDTDSGSDTDAGEDTDSGNDTDAGNDSSDDSDEAASDSSGGGGGSLSWMLLVLLAGFRTRR